LRLPGSTVRACGAGRCADTSRFHRPSPRTVGYMYPDRNGSLRLPGGTVRACGGGRCADTGRFHRPSPRTVGYMHPNPIACATPPHVPHRHMRHEMRCQGPAPRPRGWLRLWPHAVRTVNTSSSAESRTRRSDRLEHHLRAQQALRRRHHSGIIALAPALSLPCDGACQGSLFVIGNRIQAIRGGLVTQHPPVGRGDGNQAMAGVCAG